ncbi:hypothetical protein [Mycobacteroides abscessus]|uniref:hypothetical protein n=1 Tax=Mycobacteroides abscessus TaxID=36809 RepID=UPI002103F931|nr:hypothetical protein [Mycobacteroides abscessus]
MSTHSTPHPRGCRARLALLAAFGATAATIAFMSITGQNQHQATPTVSIQTTPTADAMGLSTHQIITAQEIVAAGHRAHVPDNAIVAALAASHRATAWTNYANTNVPESLHYPHEAIGADQRAVGIFQQSAYRASVADLMNPSRAADLFYTDLQTIPGWQHLDAATAAQQVQHSATPDNYAASIHAAQRYLTDTNSTVKGTR